MDYNGNGTLKINHKNSSIEQHTWDRICCRSLWASCWFLFNECWVCGKGKSKKTAWQVYGPR